MKNTMLVMMAVGVMGAASALAQDATGDLPQRQPEQFRQQIESRLHAQQMEAAEQRAQLQQEIMNLRTALSQTDRNQGPQVGGDMHRGVPPARHWRGHAMHGFCALFMLVFVVHILLAVWVFQDIRRRNAGSGIWIVVTLLTGLCGAAVYALVRIGEKQP